MVAVDTTNRKRVLLCPRDEADRLTADLMLSVDANRWEVKVAGNESLASELMEMVAEYEPAVVLIAACRQVASPTPAISSHGYGADSPKRTC